MIRSIHALRVAKSDAEFQALVDFFDALGLARGEAWKGRRSKGAKFVAPDAGVEIGHGRGFPTAEVVVEVTSADAAYELARQRKFKIAEKIADTEWDARIFTLAAPGGWRVAIFSYNEARREEAREGTLEAGDRRFGVVVSRFNAFITDRLLEGTLDGLRRCGAKKDDVEVVRVPGSFEIPAAARQMAASGRFDALICLGCILRGETTHNEVLAAEVARGIGQSAQETGVPHSFGVLTCDTLEQAIDRSGLKSGNKGFEAALSAVEMAALGTSARQKAKGKRKKSKRR